MHKKSTFLPSLFFLVSFIITSLLSSQLSAQANLSLEAQASTQRSTSPILEQIEDYHLYELNTRAMLDQARSNGSNPFTLRLRFDADHDWEFVLEASKVHGEDFKFITNTGEEIQVPKNITYKGFLKNEPHTKVRLTIADHLVSGIIFDEEQHVFEALEKASMRTNQDAIVVYKSTDINSAAPTCEHDMAVPASLENSPIIPNIQENNSIPNPATNTPTNSENSRMLDNIFCPKLGITLDWQGLQVAGSVANFNADLQTIINIVNGYYEVYNVQYELNPVYVITSAPNPWTDAPGDQATLTANFAGWAFPNLTPTDYNCALLFTGTNMNGIGYAFFGHMCTDDDLRYGEIDYQYVQPITQRANLTTHELGHLWGAQHVGTSELYIMSPSIYDGNLQWHPTSSSTISTAVNNTFNTCLPACDGGGTAMVIRGPYLQKGTNTSEVIQWRTSSNTDSYVWYGNSPDNLTEMVTVAGSRSDHIVEISSLNPNTTYYYAVGDNTGPAEGGTADYYFKTAPQIGTNQPITAWVLGDCGTADGNQQAVRDAYYNYIGNNHTDMILMLGDNAYNSGWDAEYQGAIFDMYDEKLRNTMTWSCPGNHDYYGEGGLNADYYDIFSFPSQGEAGGLASNTEKYFSFDYGNLHVISLDSYDENHDISSPMLTWLENDLAATLQDWIVVIFHHPPYSKGSHDSDTENRLIEMRTNVIPICEAYGVDLVLSGHSHAYERSRLINGHYQGSETYSAAIHDIDSGDGRVDGTGVYQQNTNQEGTVYIVTGSAGKISGMEGTHPIMYYSDNILGSTILEVNGGQMDIKFLTGTGVLEDYLTLQKNGVPTLGWTHPTDEQVFTDMSSINLEATAIDNDGTITDVEFFVDNVSIGTDNSAPYTMDWTPPSFADYVLRIVTTDNDGNTVSSEINITVQDGESFDICSQVNSSSDDAEETVSSGNVDLTSTDLELVDEGGNSPQEVGMRFTNLSIPRGATILEAYIQFTADETPTETTNLTIYGEDADNATTFLDATNNISNRTKTSASVNWMPPIWPLAGTASTDQQTPDLTNIVQEIIDRPGWMINNSMVFLVNGSGRRTAEAYDGEASSAPRLCVTYTPGEDLCAPFTDADMDGFCSDVDCNDNDPNIHPNATEICDGMDNNCNMQTDEVNCNDYCVPLHAGTENELITNVSVGTINNTTEGWNTAITGYSNYRHISTQVDVGSTYSLGVTANLSWDNSRVGMWADWNQNGVFDANENIGSFNGAGPWTANFTPPNDALEGTTRLRIRLQYDPNYTPHPCDATDYNSGETEDYSLEVINCTANVYYADDDEDGYGNPALSIVACTPPNGYVLDDTDCDDTNTAIHPTAPCDDENPLTHNDQYDLNCTCLGALTPNATIINATITTGSDDVEEYMTNGNIRMSSTDLEMAYDNETAQTVGLRFNNLNIPQGANVGYAYIQFTTQDSYAETTTLNIFGEAADNAAPFQDIAYHVTDRTPTNNSVPWSPSVWSAPDADVAQQTPDLSAVIQEIVNRNGWSAGHSMVIMVDGSGTRSAEAYEGHPNKVPQLFIEYTLPSLAVDLLSFSGQQKGQTIPLKWETATETDNQYFELKRSTDGRHFQPIAKIDSRGNSTYSQDYQFIDESPALGLNYYQLCQVNVDGRVTNLELIAVPFKMETGLSVFPNPVMDGTVALSWTHGVEERVVVDVFGVDGALVRSEAVLAGVGANRVALDVGGLAAGVYACWIVGAGERYFGRFLVE